MPLPVLAAPRTSRPLRARGVARVWISVRVWKWEACRPDAVGSERGSSENFVGVVVLRSYKTN